MNQIVESLHQHPASLRNRMGLLILTLSHDVVKSRCPVRRIIQLESAGGTFVVGEVAESCLAVDGYSERQYTEKTPKNKQRNLLLGPWIVWACAEIFPKFTMGSKRDRATRSSQRTRKNASAPPAAATARAVR